MPLSKGMGFEEDPDNYSKLKNMVKESVDKYLGNVYNAEDAFKLFLNKAKLDIVDHTFDDVRIYELWEKSIEFDKKGNLVRIA